MNALKIEMLFSGLLMGVIIGGLFTIVTGQAPKQVQAETTLKMQQEIVNHGAGHWVIVTNSLPPTTKFEWNSVDNAR